MKIIDITGRRFGRWIVLGFASRECRRTIFLCRCDCGVERNVGSLSLLRTNKPSRSCGCGRPPSKGSISHGYRRRGVNDREYSIWKNMRNRCLNPRNPSFSRYGAAGVAVCERWSDFAAFLADMGRAPTPLHTLDRKDNAKGYDPDNCKWSTQAEQQRNRTNNKLDEAKAAEIRHRRAAGETFASLGVAFGVSKKMAMDVVNGKAWAP